MRLLIHVLVTLALGVSLTALTSCAAQNSVDLSVSPVYGSGSVWQRGQPVQLKGTASAGQQVVLDGKELFGEVTTEASSDGQWHIDLPAREAGGPFQFTLRSNGQALALNDIYLGDVYVLSGQSNMEWLVSNSNDAARASTVSDPMLRHLKVPLIANEAPQSSLPDIDWVAAAPGKTDNFSAVGFYFAEALRKRDPAVAIGLVNSSWGGSRIEAWLPASTPSAIPKKEVPAETRAVWAQLQRDYPRAFSEVGIPRRPHGRDGVPTEVGRKWEWTGYPDVDGQIWLDREFTLTAAQAQGPATLVLGAIDDSDSTFVNGTFVGGMHQAYAKTRRYALPAGTLTAGENALSIWVEDTGGGGGLYQSPDSVYLLVGDQRLPLATEPWRSRPQRLSVDSTGEVNHTPTLLYNAMLHPLQGLKASAVLWYQGESNAGGLDEARAYANQMVQLASTFRELTGQPKLPVLVVELPDFTAPWTSAYAEYDWWPHLRTSQRAVLAFPPAAAVPTLGLGDANDIHPRDKRPVGERLAEEARRLVYGEADRPTAARAKGLEFQGSNLTVAFSDVGSGLRGADGQPVRGVAVQDATGKWHASEVTLLGDDRLRIDLPAGVTQPRAVAYAWANNPVGANLVNGWGLPVSSFQFTLEE